MDFIEEKYEYVVANATLVKDTLTANEPVDIVDGTVVGMAAISRGNNENRIIDLGIFQNNNEVVKTCDVSFSEKTNGGTFKDSMRPVDFAGGKQFQIRLFADTTSPTDNVRVQVMFMVRKPQLQF